MLSKLSRFFHRNSAAPAVESAPVVPQIVEKRTQTFSTKATGNNKGGEYNSAKLTHFSFEIQKVRSPYDMHTYSGYTNTTYKCAMNVYTQDQAFEIDLVFDATKDNIPFITNQITKQDFLVDQFDSVTKQLLSQRKEKVTTQDIHVMNMPLVDFLKQYRNVENVEAFLKLYENANKVFTVTEDVEEDTFTYVPK